MKTLIIYNSFHHQNTEKITNEIAQVLGAEIAKPETVKIEELGNYDLIGFGSGVYLSKPHRSLFQLIDQLPLQNNKKAFIFFTSGLFPIKFINDFQTPLLRALENKGFAVISGFNCRGWDTYGLMKYLGGINRQNPNEKDLQKARDFAQKLLQIK